MRQLKIRTSHIFVTCDCHIPAWFCPSCVTKLSHCLFCHPEKPTLCFFFVCVCVPSVRSVPEADSSSLNWNHVWGICMTHAFFFFIFKRKTFGPIPGHGNYITWTYTVQLPVKPAKVTLLSPAVKTASVFLEILGGEICLQSGPYSRTFGSQQ